ncbi:MAG: hypothetical protein K2P68_01505 [Sphingomonas sp.]|nr:hypothetical protein [Sphingomonas sp.]
MTETPAEKAEAAAIRRRWITLGEFVAVAGLIISALAFWNSFVDRRADEADRRAERLTETRQRRAVLLVASPSSSGRQLDLRDPIHPIQSVTISYPRSLSIAPTSSAGRLTVAADWFSGPLLALTDAGPDIQSGKLPVIIAADYWDGDNHVTDQAIYDVLWRTEGRVLRGRAVRLDGLVLRQRNHATQAQIDALWKRLAPKPQR